MPYIKVRSCFGTETCIVKRQCFQYWCVARVSVDCIASMDMKAVFEEVAVDGVLVVPRVAALCTAEGAHLLQARTATKRTAIYTQERTNIVK